MNKHIVTTLVVFCFGTSSLLAGDGVYNVDDGVKFKNSQKTYVMPPVNKQPVVKIAPPVDPMIPAPLLGFNGSLVPGMGMKVNYVNSFSKAERIGLEPNDIIETINGVNIHSHHQYQQLLREALQFNNGFVSMRVHNSRPWPAPQHVILNFRLDEATGQPAHVTYNN